MRLWILYLSILSLLSGSFSDSLGQARVEKNETREVAKSKKAKKTKIKRCKKKSIDLCSLQIKEGIRGKILEFKGNLMPSPGQPAPTGNPVKRKIAAFELTTLDQIENGAKTGFYARILTKKVKEIYSNEQGCFSMTLKPGRYSLFIWENGEWYGNSFGGNGEIVEVEVKEKEVTEMDVTINHSAFY